MRIKEAIKSLTNTVWIFKSIKPFAFSVILIILIEVSTSITSVAMAVASKNIIDYASKSDMQKALLYAGLFIFIIIYNMAADAFLSVYSTRTTELYSNSMRQGIFLKLINMEWLQVSRYHSGDLLTRLTSDIEEVADGSVSIFPSIVGLGVQMVAAFFTLLVYEPRLAALAFFMAPVTILLSRLYAKKLRHMHIKIQETESSYRSNMQEFLQNILILKTFNLENQSAEKVGELQKERLHWITERSKTGAAANTIIAAGYWLGYFLAFGWGALKLANKTTTFGTMTAFLQLVNQIQSPFIGLSSSVPQIISALASAGRLIELENMDAEARETNIDIPQLAGVRFKDVSFRYEKDEQVLDKVSFEALPGEIVAITGTSGEGKTTMLRLMLALLKPGSGEVLCFDEKGNEYTVSSALRNWFSYVPQGNTLFSGTIIDNLRAGLPGAEEEEMRAALSAACAMEFVEKLPEGLNTVIGEKGLGLSEGQAQRIAIARALLRNSPIIVFDEATSALDIELEERMLKNIRNLNPTRTCIMITHRRTSLDICNRVYKLKENRLALDMMNGAAINV